MDRPPEYERDRSRARSRWRWLGTAAFFAAVGFVAWFLTDRFEGALDAFQDADPGWLAAAAIAEVGVYVAITVLLAALFGPAVKTGALVLFRVGLVLYGMGTVVPGAPAPGLALATIELRRRGLEPARITLALMWCSWFIVRAFLVLAILAAAVALSRDRVPESLTAPVIAVAAFIGVGLAGVSFFANRPWTAERAGRLAARLPWRGGPIRELERVHDREWKQTAVETLGSGPRRLAMSGAAFASWSCDAICLGLALRAVGLEPGFSLILMAYVSAMAVSLIPFTSGGLGLVELATPAVLHYFGVPFAQAFAGVIVWRALALLLPAAVGVFALATLRIQKPRVANGESGPSPGPPAAAPPLWSREP